MTEPGLDLAELLAEQEKAMNTIAALAAPSMNGKVKEKIGA